MFKPQLIRAKHFINFEVQNNLKMFGILKTTMNRYTFKFHTHIQKIVPMYDLIYLNDYKKKSYV